MYEKLLIKITADHANQTQTEIAAALNARSIPVAVPVHSAEIKKYLILAGKYMPIKSSDNAAAQIAIEVLSTFEVLNVQEPHVSGVLSNILSALVAAELIAAEDVTVIIGMGQELRSWAQINLGHDVQEWQIEEALNGN